jgi:hypothetical protein
MLKKIQFNFLNKTIFSLFLIFFFKFHHNNRKINSNNLKLMSNLSLDEIREKISQIENESLLICNDLLELCDRALPKAQAFYSTEKDQLNQLDTVQESFNKIYKDLFETNTILHKVFLCPCLPESLLLNCFTNSSNYDDDQYVKKINKEKKRGKLILIKVFFFFLINSSFNFLKAIKSKNDKKDEVEKYIKHEFSYLELLKELKDKTIITVLTNSEKESEMDRSLSIVFSKLINLQTISLEQLKLQHKQDKKIIEIRFKSELTSLLLESHKKSLKQF